METAIENPVIKGDDAEGQALLELAHKLDRGEVSPDSPSAEQSDTRADTTETTSSPDTTPERDAEKTDSRPRDAQGRFTKTETGEDIPEAERKPVAKETDSRSQSGDSTPVGDVAKPESAYQRAQKEAERKERSWQQLEEEKRQVRAEAERIQREREEIEAYRQQVAQQQRPQQQNGQQLRAPEEYADLAEECTAAAEAALTKGDYDEADKQYKLAAKAARATILATQQQVTAQQQGYQQQMLEHLKYDADEAIRREPELQDRNSPLGQETSKVLQEYGPILDQIPVTRLANGKQIGGFSIAVEVAKLRRQAGAASGLEEENKKLKAQVADLNGRLSIGGSGPTGPSSPRKLEDMSIEEMGRYLEGKSREWDRAA